MVLCQRVFLCLAAMAFSHAMAFQHIAPPSTTTTVPPSSSARQLGRKGRAAVTPATTTIIMARKTILDVHGSTSSLRMSEDDGGWSAPKSAMIGGAGVNNAGEPPFEIRGFSLGNVVCLAGLVITVASFVDYLSDADTGLSVSGLGFVYGIPVFLAGAALKYAEIDPVPVVSSPAADAVFATAATDTILKITQDVTRHRYGDEAHLDTTVKKLGLVVPGKDYPQLQELRKEVASDGRNLVFTMVWQSLDTPYKMWADERRVEKYATFFGPNVTAEVVKVDAERRLVGIRLTTTTQTTTTTSPNAGGTAAAAAATTTTPTTIQAS